MRIIAKATLKKFWENPAHRDAEQPLKSWYEEVWRADWSRPNDAKAQFGNASVLGGNRLVFNTAGNKYRLVVAVNCKYHCMYVCFVGTHRQYDKVDAEKVWEI